MSSFASRMQLQLQTLIEHSNQNAIQRLFEVTRDLTANLLPMSGVFPDYPAPIVRQSGTERELTLARWGMPSSQKALMDATTTRANKLRAKGSGWIEARAKTAGKQDGNVV